MPRWLPNLLTIARLLLVPFVIRAILVAHHTEALLLFSCAAVTDLLDGAIARRFRLTSQAGAYLDPIADKVLLSGVFLALAFGGYLPWWIVVLIFCRDIYILLAVLLLLWLTPVRKFPPSQWGKTSTFFQVFTAVFWMARNLLNVPVLSWLSLVILWPCAVLTIWSGVHYTWRGVQVVRAH
jgi:cardiolipin synthase